MTVTIVRYYHSLPDVRTLSASEIRLFYEWLKGELIENTKKPPQKV